MSTDRFDWSDVAISDDLQSVVERMARAKWVTGRALVTPSMVTLHLTDLGRRKIVKLASYVRPFEDRFLCGHTSKVSFWDHLKLRWVLAIHAARLLLPLLSHGEDLAFICLLVSEARKLRLGETQ